MQFEEDYLYHIYNQGNNRQQIFFSRENYLFFLKKIRRYLLPYCDILAYCLMPNHFHFMVRVNDLTLPLTEDFTPSEVPEVTTEGFTSNEALSNNHSSAMKYRDLNQSIGIMLRSYTRAINTQRNISGSLFRKETKAECLNQSDGVSPSFYNTEWGTASYPELVEKQYPQVCFEYIHQNPVVAGLVKNANDWDYSSAKDYAGLRNGTLLNKAVAREYLLI